MTIPGLFSDSCPDKGSRDHRGPRTKMSDCELCIQGHQASAHTGPCGHSSPEPIKWDARLRVTLTMGNSPTLGNPGMGGAFCHPPQMSSSLQESPRFSGIFYFTTKIFNWVSVSVHLHPQLVVKFICELVFALQFCLLPGMPVSLVPTSSLKDFSILLPS